MENVKRYEEHVIWKLLRWSGIIIIPIITLIPYKSLIRALIKSYYNMNYFEVIIGGLTATLGYAVLFYIGIATFIEFYTVAVKVELHEDRVVGYPWYGKKKFEMKYEEIEVINIKFHRKKRIFVEKR